MPGTAAMSSTLAPRSDPARPEDAQERALARRAHALEVVERRALRRALARTWRWYVIAKRWASSRSRCTQIERLRRRGQHDGVAATGQEELLALLGDPGQRQVVEPELVEHRARGADLALAAVDDDEVGQAPAELLGAALVGTERAPEASPQDLLVAREVVLAGDAADAEAAVLAAARPAVLEDDHAADRGTCPGSC